MRSPNDATRSLARGESSPRSLIPRTRSSSSESSAPTCPGSRPRPVAMSSWRFLRAFASTCLPVAASLARARSWSVTPACAETTTTGRSPRSRERRTIAAAFSMREGSPSDVPPNFMTIILSSPPRSRSPGTGIARGPDDLAVGPRDLRIGGADRVSLVDRVEPPGDRRIGAGGGRSGLGDGRDEERIRLRVDGVTVALDRSLGEVVDDHVLLHELVQGRVGPPPVIRELLLAEHLPQHEQR